MIQSIYSVLMTGKVEESRLFYKSYLDFIETYSSDWYISLSHPDGGELALIDATHETIPVSNRSTVGGMIINIEVENATQMYNDIKQQNTSIIVIPPSAEFQSNYTGGM